MLELVIIEVSTRRYALVLRALPTTWGRPSPGPHDGATRAVDPSGGDGVGL